jgi:serine/threonine-protein kinase ULK4
MAPELFRDDGVYSYQSDFWGIGCVLHELAVGKPPFVSDSFQELVNLILKADTPRVE